MFAYGAIKLRKDVAKLVISFEKRTFDSRNFKIFLEYLCYCPYFFVYLPIKYSNIHIMSTDNQLFPSDNEQNDIIIYRSKDGKVNVALMTRDGKV